MHYLTYFSLKFQMGSFLSVPTHQQEPVFQTPQHITEGVDDLRNRGACSKCIQRLMSLDRQTSNRLCPTTDHEHDCFICHGVLEIIPKVKQIVSDAIGPYSYHDVQIEIPPNFIKDDDKICRQYNLPTSCNIKNYLKAKLNHELPHTNSGPTLILHIAGPSDIKCKLKWPDLYITGRYFKRSRRVSNSRFFKGFSITSVESELIKEFSKYVKCSQFTFASSGREDADVRMIGSGRPFALKMKDPVPPHPPKDIDEYVESLNALIPSEVECENCVGAAGCHIVLVQPSMEPKHMKRYRSVVTFSRPVSDEELSRIEGIENLVLHQRTPLRVAQKKEIQDRERTIMKLGYERISPRFILLDLETSKGTYIKEFVNSDFGRTVPSLGQLLNPEDPPQCQLLQLDVVYVAEE